MNKALILAGGLGKRMNSPKPKVLHEVLGKPLINWVIDAARSAGADEIGVVVGHSAQDIYPFLKDVKVFVQKEQLGTADAVKSALPFLDGRILILYADMPLIPAEILRKLFDSEADLVVLTASLSNPFGYGRVLRKNGKIEKIVEEADASDEIRSIKEVNSGVYVFNSKALLYALERIKNDNKKAEYYLTDSIEILANSDFKVETIETSDPDTVMGVNTQRELASLIRRAREMINFSLMDSGVTIEDPDTTFIGPDAKIEPGVTVKPFTFIYGKTEVSSGSTIGPYAVVLDCKIGSKSVVISSDCNGAIIGENCSIGPFSRLRPGTVIENNVKVGNYVEVKNSHLFNNVKAQHLTYLGDATIGENTNIGAGTITCNYDGVKKNQTFIGKNAFIGSNTALVAPVKVGDNAFVGAGSTITEDVPPNALALGRARQVNKEEWVKRRESDEK
ncbi:bifunctional UDP-N-acetylglucosamine diphosphorylase/glucosamine-1-phosphate N-acetyltransferase GlmU [Athalassotoga saccharophila]|uniref:bifunctional UDP-N-acetylglucosamine diphosphorylase/glucosamine-1-phosphate N-acetyltransferase GlmU n=1 Tax=Athalassotoga saccharophila TaxID=1441386 RepID=UPI00137999A0|nr:bifunctional UDP-N-acetylglucosamine diphosphorylase/glucosamine-1-phosphate N-acetyltransferase GlmU [Athalassotoga saccharophila]BBJ28233.1 bifunctional protein GlmU [Athalassotoga saccharophila]